MTKTSTRSDLGFGAALDDLGNFSATAEPAVPKRSSQNAARAVAEAAGFRSREPQTPKEIPVVQPAQMQPPQSASRPVRRRRTGRNAQFNLKARPETIDAFCAVADANEWGLGETLEHAVELLQERYGAGQGRR